MKLIVGLGNPGREYLFSRHNIGFMVIDHVIASLPLISEKKAFQGLLYQGTYQGEKFILLKPQTYMNLSGDCVQAVMNYYQITPQDILVVFDDMDLPIGSLRLREKGGAGGHNGMKHIISCINTQEFKRMRLGIGRKDQMDAKDYVLGNLGKEERQLIQPLLEKARLAILDFMILDFNKVMSRYNGSTGEEQ